MADNKKLSIIAFSGDFDKLTAVFTLGTGAAAVGYEVNIFFTFWGLDAIKRKQGRSFTGGNWLTKIFGFMMGGLKATPTSRFNFLGAGPKIFRYLMRKNNVATLEELVEAAKALGINLYACEMAMHVLGLKKEDFIHLKPTQALPKGGMLRYINNNIYTMGLFKNKSNQSPRSEEGKGSHVLDITKEHCPMTFVKTKIELSKLQSGEILEVLLSEGEPLDNVPRNAKEQGYHVLSVEHVEGTTYKVTIQK